MQGQIALFIRLALYWLAGNISAVGWMTFDRAAGTLTVNLNSLSIVMAGVLVAAATWLWSRVAKSRGGMT